MEVSLFQRSKALGTEHTMYPKKYIEGKALFIEVHDIEDRRQGFGGDFPTATPHLG